MNAKRVLCSHWLTHRAWRAAQVVLIVMVLIGAGWPVHLPAQAGDAPAAAPGTGQTPPAELLDQEGRLDLASGFRGSIDARGWQLVSGPDEAPAFAALALEQEGGQWSGIFQPPGTDSLVWALAADGAGNLYAGGTFNTAGGVAVNNIAKWDGGAWSALGGGLGGTVFPRVSALVLDDAGNLYVGGEFATAGGVSASHIAKWNGSAWSALGSGINGVVNALIVDGAGNLNAGGRFTTAGGVAANNIAMWDGSAWSALGSGMDAGNDPWGNPIAYVNALAVDSAGNLCAGGYFITAGDVTANNIAEWDGSTWSALGSGIGGEIRVNALAVDGIGNLYAGGSFTTAGSVAANYIAR